jgi:hypothetical protein
MRLVGQKLSALSRAVSPPMLSPFTHLFGPDTPSFPFLPPP